MNSGLAFTSASSYEAVRGAWTPAHSCLSRGGRVAVEVRAHEPGAVPRGVEPGRDRGAFEAEAVRGLEASVRPAVRLDPGVVRVLAAQRRRTRRAAQRHAHEVVREAHAPVAEQG